MNGPSFFGTEIIVLRDGWWVRALFTYTTFAWVQRFFLPFVPLYLYYGVFMLACVGPLPYSLSVFKCGYLVNLLPAILSVRILFRLVREE